MGGLREGRSLSETVRGEIRTLANRSKVRLFEDRRGAFMAPPCCGDFQAMANRGSSPAPKAPVPGNAQARPADPDATTVELAGLKASGLLAATLAVGEVGRLLLLADPGAAVPAAAVGFGAVLAARMLWRGRLRAPAVYGADADKAHPDIGELLAQRSDWLARFARRWEPSRNRGVGAGSASGRPVSAPAARPRVARWQRFRVASPAALQADSPEDASPAPSSRVRAPGRQDLRREPLARHAGGPQGPALAEPVAPETALPGAPPGSGMRAAPTHAPLPPPSDLLTEAEVRALLRVSRSTFYRMRRKGSFPKPVQLSESIQRWRRSDVIAHLAGPEAVPPRGPGHRVNRPRFPR